MLGVVGDVGGVVGDVGSVTGNARGVADATDLEKAWKKHNKPQQQTCPRQTSNKTNHAKKSKEIQTNQKRNTTLETKRNKKVKTKAHTKKHQQIRGAMSECLAPIYPLKALLARQR